MATGFVTLFPGGFAPDGSTNNAAAALSYENNSGTPTTGTPDVHRLTLLFGELGTQATEEHWLFQFKMPEDYASGGTLRGDISSSTAVSTVVRMKAGFSRASGNRTDDTFVALNETDVTLSGTANQDVEFTISLTMTSAAPGDGVVLFIGRSSAHANDTLSGDAVLSGLNFEYVTT